MIEAELPPDLVTFLGAGSPQPLHAAHYGTVSLIPLTELRVETLAVTPNMAPFACNHPHVNEYGHYAVPAINLVVPRGPKEWEWFPAWLFLWLPVERRYGSYDIDHGDLRIFGPGVSWSH